MVSVSGLNARTARNLPPACSADQPVSKLIPGSRCAGPNDVSFSELQSNLSAVADDNPGIPVVGLLSDHFNEVSQRLAGVEVYPSAFRSLKCQAPGPLALDPNQVNTGHWQLGLPFADWKRMDLDFRGDILPQTITVGNAKG